MYQKAHKFAIAFLEMADRIHDTIIIDLELKERLHVYADTGSESPALVSPYFNEAVHEGNPTRIQISNIDFVKILSNCCKAL